MIKGRELCSLKLLELQQALKGGAIEILPYAMLVPSLVTAAIPTD